MEILSGLFEHMVWQRTNRNRSDALVTGTTSATGRISAQVTKGTRTVARAVAPIRRGTFSLRIKGAPTGGPYQVTLAAGKERLTVKDVLVGDVWLCSGQSNMQGIGWLKHADKPHPLVRAFYMTDEWRVARDPINDLSTAVAEIHKTVTGPVPPCTHWGVGPAVSFGQRMLQLTGVPQGLIACAHGATSMSQWDPAKKEEGNRSLYGAMLKRFEKNGSRIAGMIWYQGESDASSLEVASLYTIRMKEFVRCLRRDTRSPRLPVAMVQIGRLFETWFALPCWHSIREQQRHLAVLIPHLTVVPAIDLRLDDEIHIGGPDNTRLGHRLAEAMNARQHSAPTAQPIRLRRTKIVPDPSTKLANVVLEFDNVVGRLISAGRPSGFDVGAPDPSPVLFDIELDGSRVILRTRLKPGEMASKQVHYGYGLNPYCNITDEAHRPLLAFTNVPLGTARALTPFVHMRVTELLPGAGKLENLTCPSGPLPWRNKTFTGDFCNLHPELGPLAPADYLVYFACDVTVPEPMKLAACLGYDGPVKLWIDGKELFHDPNGVNPGRPDKARIDFDATRGRHEVLVALGSNHGLAWGIHFRLERRDVTQKQLWNGPGAYRLPAIS